MSIRIRRGGHGAGGACGLRGGVAPREDANYIFWFCVYRTRVRLSLARGDEVSRREPRAGPSGVGRGASYMDTRLRILKL